MDKFWIHLKCNFNLYIGLFCLFTVGLSLALTTTFSTYATFINTLNVILGSANLLVWAGKHDRAKEQQLIDDLLEKDKTSHVE